VCFQVGLVHEAPWEVGVHGKDTDRISARGD
jgi:hypothetical protein